MPEKAKITWNGPGGELSAVTVEFGDYEVFAITQALIKLVQGQIVSTGDSFTVQEVKE